MERTILLVTIFLSLAFCLSAQNLVPNPSFEGLRNLPVKPNPRNSYEFEPNSGYIPYIKNLQDWFAATETTPDLRMSSPDLARACERTYDDCDLARTGFNCVGIITFLANKLTRTYREYIQVKLTQPLKPGVPAYVEFWVAKERLAKLITNNIGVHFSVEKVSAEIQENLPLVPQINCDTVLNSFSKTWTRISATFIPDKPYRYLLIGNFFDNEQTDVFIHPNYTGYPYTTPYAYYLIDDVRVWQEELPEETLIFAETPVEKERPIALKNIEFEFDSAELKPSSTAELSQLLDFLETYPNLKIMIQGHADRQGREGYNQQLSEARAQSVYRYLIAQGIAPERLAYEGFGETAPLNAGETKLEQSKNRRVAFVVLEVVSENTHR